MKLNKKILGEVEKRLLSKKLGFYQKNVVNISYLDYLDFRAQLGMKINDLLQFENMDTICCYDFNDKMK